MRLSARWLPMKPAPPVIRTRSGSGRGALASFTNASGAPPPFPFAYPFPFPFLLPFPPWRCVTPADLRAYDRRGWTARWIVSGNATMPPARRSPLEEDWGAVPTWGEDAAGQDHGTPSGLLPSSGLHGRAPRVLPWSRSTQQLLVEARGAVHHGRVREPKRPLARGLAHPLRLVRMLENPADGGSQAPGIARRHLETGDPVQVDVGRARPDACRDHRESGMHRLDHREPEGLAPVEGGQNEEVRGLVVAAQIGLWHIAREHHALRKSLPLDLAPYLLLRLSLTHQHQGSRRLRDRIDQDRNPLVRTHAADKEDVRPRMRPAQRGRDLSRALRLLQIRHADTQRQHLAAGAMRLQ